MPSLQVRDLPDHIYYKLQKKASSEHRSLAQEAVIILAEGLNSSRSPKLRREQLLQDIGQNKPDKSVLLIDPVDLLRDDRQR